MHTALASVAGRAPGGGLVERLCGADMCEVFSPPRVGLEAAKFGVQVGVEIDFTIGCGFNRENDRREAEESADQENTRV